MTCNKLFIVTLTDIFTYGAANNFPFLKVMLYLTNKQKRSQIVRFIGLISDVNEVTFKRNGVFKFMNLKQFTKISVK